MSKADTPSSQELPHNARQILDELDALMDRMMALPVQDGGEAFVNAGAAKTVEPISAAATIEADPTPVSEPTKPEPAPANDPDGGSTPALKSYTIPADQLKAPNERPSYVTSDSQSESESELNPWSEILPPISPVPKYEPPKRIDDPIPTVGWHPLLRLNEIFDRSTRWMGPIGIWLRGKWGRALLGIAGLALLVFAVLWGVSILGL